MNNKGELSRTDVRLLNRYVSHLKAMKKDVQTKQEVLDELEWLAEAGFCRKIKKGLFARTKKGKKLFRILRRLESEKK